MNMKGNAIFVCFPCLQSDVNTVCFADESGHLIYSGSDDALCKVNSDPIYHAHTHTESVPFHVLTNKFSPSTKIKGLQHQTRNQYKWLSQHFHPSYNL